MTGCQTLSQRMPEVAHGRAQWTAVEAAHLEACSTCATEWRLVQAAAGLGAGIAFEPDAVAEAIRVRLAATPPPAPAGRFRKPIWWLVPLAAAAAILLAVWSKDSISTGPATPQVEVGPVLSELDGLTDLELEAVLDAMTPPVAADVAPDRAFRDLTDQELERVLRSLGG